MQILTRSRGGEGELNEESKRLRLPSGHKGTKVRIPSSPRRRIRLVSGPSDAGNHHTNNASAKQECWSIDNQTIFVITGRQYRGEIEREGV